MLALCCDIHNNNVGLVVCVGYALVLALCCDIHNNNVGLVVCVVECYL